MNTKDYNRDQEISMFIMLPEEILRKLHAKNIFTIGQLVGVTKGFSAHSDLLISADGHDYTDEIRSMIPEEQLKKAKEHYFRPPMGLLKKNDPLENDENEKEQNDEK